VDVVSCKSGKLGGWRGYGILLGAGSGSGASLVDESEYQGFLDLVYDSAVEPDLWPSVLQRLGEIAGAPYAALIHQDEATGKGHTIRWNIDPACGNDFYGHFATRNPLHNTADPEATIRQWRPCVLTDEDKISKQELLRTEYYNDFMRRWDFHSVMMIRVALHGMDTVTINLSRPRTREQYGSEEMEFARRIQPHLIRAFYLGQRVSRVRIFGDDLVAWMDRSPDALFLLGADRRISHLNQAARALLASSPSLRDVGGRLAATRPVEARRLDRLVAAATAPEDASRTGAAMLLERLPQSRPLHLTVAPLRGGGRQGAVVCISDLEARANPRQQALQDIFGLTVAEARVAVALFEGATLKEAAEVFGVTRLTVRNQLAAIFEKTDTNRQSDLVRLLARTVKPEMH